MNLSHFTNLLFKSSTVAYGNMSFLRGDLTKNYQNRLNFLKALQIKESQIVAMAAQHHNEVLTMKDTHSCKGLADIDHILKVDGLITNLPNVFLFLLTGDCIPIGIFDPVSLAIGLIHGSWKSLDLKILDNTILLMSQHFKSQPSDLLVEFGPSIGPCCYRGLDSLQQQDDPKWQPFIFKHQNRYGVDLWKFAKEQLLSLGIKNENINNPQACTFHNKNYYSHRQAMLTQDKLDPRFATIIGVDE